MDETPRKRLARLISGVPANSSPMPNFATGAEANMSPMQLPQIAPPPARSPYEFLPPYAGLKNDMTLPPFEQPGGSLPMDRYLQPQAQPTSMPQGPAAPFAPPAMTQSGGQGWGGPEPAPGTIPDPYDPMNDPRYLPEQWKGAFNPRWQK